MKSRVSKFRLADDASLSSSGDETSGNEEFFIPKRPNIDNNKNPINTNGSAISDHTRRFPDYNWNKTKKKTFDAKPKGPLAEAKQQKKKSPKACSDLKPPQCLINCSPMLHYANVQSRCGFMPAKTSHIRPNTICTPVVKNGRGDIADELCRKYLCQDNPSPKRRQPLARSTSPVQRCAPRRHCNPCEHHDLYNLGKSRASCTPDTSCDPCRPCSPFRPCSPCDTYRTRSMSRSCSPCDSYKPCNLPKRNNPCSPRSPSPPKPCSPCKQRGDPSCGPCGPCDPWAPCSNVAYIPRTPWPSCETSGAARTERSPKVGNLKVAKEKPAKASKKGKSTGTGKVTSTFNKKDGKIKHAGTNNASKKGGGQMKMNGQKTGSKKNRKQAGDCISFLSSRERCCSIDYCGENSGRKPQTNDYTKRPQKPRTSTPTAMSPRKLVSKADKSPQYGQMSDPKPKVVKGKTPAGTNEIKMKPTEKKRAASEPPCMSREYDRCPSWRQMQPLPQCTETPKTSRSAKNKHKKTIENAKMDNHQGAVQHTKKNEKRKLGNSHKVKIVETPATKQQGSQRVGQSTPNPNSSSRRYRKSPATKSSQTDMQRKTPNHFLKTPIPSTHSNRVYSNHNPGGRHKTNLYDSFSNSPHDYTSPHKPNKFETLLASPRSPSIFQTDFKNRSKSRPRSKSLDEGKLASQSYNSEVTLSSQSNSQAVPEYKILMSIPNNITDAETDAVLKSIRDIIERRASSADGRRTNPTARKLKISHMTRGAAAATGDSTDNNNESIMGAVDSCNNTSNIPATYDIDENSNKNYPSSTKVILDRGSMYIKQYRKPCQIYKNVSSKHTYQKLPDSSLSDHRIQTPEKSLIDIGLENDASRQRQFDTLDNPKAEHDKSAPDKKNTIYEDATFGKSHSKSKLLNGLQSDVLPESDVKNILPFRERKLDAILQNKIDPLKFGQDPFINGRYSGGDELIGHRVETPIPTPSPCKDCRVSVGQIEISRLHHKTKDCDHNMDPINANNTECASTDARYETTGFPDDSCNTSSSTITNILRDLPQPPATDVDEEKQPPKQHKSSNSRKTGHCSSDGIRNYTVVKPTKATETIIEHRYSRGMLKTANDSLSSGDFGNSTCAPVSRMASISSMEPPNVNTIYSVHKEAKPWPKAKISHHSENISQNFKAQSQNEEFSDLHVPQTTPNLPDYKHKTALDLCASGSNSSNTSSVIVKTYISGSAKPTSVGQVGITQIMNTSAKMANNPDRTHTSDHHRTRSRKKFNPLRKRDNMKSPLLANKSFTSISSDDFTSEWNSEYSDNSDSCFNHNNSNNSMINHDAMTDDIAGLDGETVHFQLDHFMLGLTNHSYTNRQTGNNRHTYAFCNIVLFEFVTNIILRILYTFRNILQYIHQFLYK